MRGKVTFWKMQNVKIRITPAYAGKRVRTAARTAACWDHPRLCGEKLYSQLKLLGWNGSPPPMRGKVRSGVCTWKHGGITPAYAGKSRKLKYFSVGIWDHPRLCGEKTPFCSKSPCIAGSPPPMRGKGCYHGGLHFFAGITPAYAGKSDPQTRSSTRTRDHPRLCGEKSLISIMSLPRTGSPPPMRGKGQTFSAHARQVRITPAYAGKSHGRGKGDEKRQDHPRLCGEKQQMQQLGDLSGGSPPPMRGKVHSLQAYFSIFKDHPRLCGEKFPVTLIHFVFTGSPPPMRGKATSSARRGATQRITLAYAGKSSLYSSTGSPSTDHPRLCGEKL